MNYIAGIDAGSISVKVAVLDETGTILGTVYRRHGGKPVETAVELLNETLQSYPSLSAIATGSTGKIIAQRLGIPHINELIAHAASTQRLFPEVRTIIEMGGEDSKLILLNDNSIEDFSLNSVCAAGTGSFLDQQAERMRLSIEEFSQQALLSKSPPRVAGRCSVFAKSDMIHLQQIATPVHDIVAGLCFAVARNFIGSIVRNRPMPKQIAFMGGVALNRGVVRAFSELLGVDDLVIPDPPTVMGAIGSAIKGLEDKSAVVITQDLLNSLDTVAFYDDQPLPPLVQAGDSFNERHLHAGVPMDSIEDQEANRAKVADLAEQAGGKIPAFMGIDVGSISTNVVVVDQDGTVLSKRYLRTAGRPIEAVMTGLTEVGYEVADFVDILGVGTTGSGRYMIADFVNADIVKNEITAQARAASFIDPTVDTIFEIGGQDSKYIMLKDGVITDFEMNKACAAGTGSFLEEQAERLSIPIKGEFARQALTSQAPCRLGERCTVFMENSLMDMLQRGAAKNDLVAGLAYSIVINYINRVVNGRRVGQNVFFQGGTAFNKSVVAAFEKYLKIKVTVPPNHDVTGAIGMALIARDHAKTTDHPSNFRGFDIVNRSYAMSSFECKSCDNHCEINRVTLEGESEALFYGGRCEKYDIRKRQKSSLPDLFAFREEALNKAHNEYLKPFLEKGARAKRGIIGLPRIFFMHDYLPYYSTLLWELGFEVALSPRTDKKTINLGVHASLADTCFPAKASLGHVKYLIDEGIKTLFVPSFVTMVPQGEPFDYGHTCPLTQSFPYQCRTAFKEDKPNIVAPIIRIKYGDKVLAQHLLEALAPFGVSKNELTAAMAKASAAQKAFTSSLKDCGRQILDNITARTLVIVGRPYNAFDMGMNLEIPKKLATLNVQAIPMDFLPDEEIYNDWPEMYWRSGQRILRAARAIKKNPKLHPLFIGNFSCGPDSFIQKFFDVEMEGKPYLHIEIDEHSADAGVITRCEAFLDSLEMQELTGKVDNLKTYSKPSERVTFIKQTGKRTVFMPPMCDHAHTMAAAFHANGVDAEVMPPTDAEAMALGRKFTSGKECYPFAVTTGDILKQVLAPDFQADKVAFLMFGGSGPCRFGQYNVVQRMILDRIGFGHVPILAPMQDMDFYAELGLMGKDFLKRGWMATVAADLMTKCLHETRPYEREKGATDALYKESLEYLCKAIAAPNLSGIVDSLGKIRRDFEHLPKNKETRPIIGIVGEIFVRSNNFSNEDLVRRIEDLGGEVWLASVDEWIYYINWESKQNAKRRGRWSTILQIKLQDYMQKRIAHALEAPFSGYLKTIHDPNTEAILAHSLPYLHHSFRGEAVLSVGKAVDMVTRSGASGVINVMPFGCMPGSVVAGILPKVAKQYQAPVISIPFDGSASPTMQLQLEAFMEQAVRRMLA